jgi:hypothetical protein
MKVFQTVSILVVLSALPCAQTRKEQNYFDTRTSNHYDAPCEDNVGSPEIIKTPSPTDEPSGAPSSKSFQILSKSKVLEFVLTTNIIFDSFPP